MGDAREQQLAARAALRGKLAPTPIFGVVMGRDNLRRYAGPEA
jgi:hypothetical protein